MSRTKRNSARSRARSANSNISHRKAQRKKAGPVASELSAELSAKLKASLDALPPDARALFDRVDNLKRQYPRLYDVMTRELTPEGERFERILAAEYERARS